MLFLVLLACQPKEEPGAGAPETTTEEPYDQGTAAVVIDVGEMAFSESLPVTLLRTDEGSEEARIVARGLTGQPIEVGVGEVEIQVGPFTFESTTGLNYYPKEDGVTGDGLPMIIEADRRYVLPRTTIDVDGPQVEVETTFVGVVGEGVYKCNWERYELDENAWDLRGDKISTLLEELEEAGIEGDGVSGQLDMVDGRTLVPDPTSPIANFCGMLQPTDELVIEPTPEGPYLSNIALKHIGCDQSEEELDHQHNELLPFDLYGGTGYGVKGTGLANFQVWYVDYVAGEVKKINFWYDWTDFANSYYNDQP